jgi:hypothetical protein
MSREMPVENIQVYGDVCKGRSKFLSLAVCLVAETCQD